MRYVSTRGGVPPCTFEDVLFAGLAHDGGLFVPETLPRLERDDLEALQGCTYEEVAAAVLTPFVGDDLDRGDLRRLIDDAYGAFGHRAVAPLRQLGASEWLLELFHGPTLAFKDIALQLLGRMFEHFLARRGHRITIIGATSGDTGSAAIHAFAGRAGMDIVILHPHGRVSEIQRRQMTTVDAPNVHNIAIEGNFDDCQALVKAMFGDPRMREELHLAAINSINWARIMAQVVYYVTAALALGAPWRRVAFAVPTGNFGDVYAGWIAAGMGLPTAQLIVATNINDILARFFASGEYRAGGVEATISPSMDIQVASNFERLLFDLSGSQAVARRMAEFGETKRLSVAPEELGRARELFDAGRADEDATRATIAEVLRSTGTLIDPHTAVGLSVGRACRLDAAIPMVALATAHPAKFPDAVRTASGTLPDVPPQLAGLLERPERYEVLPGDPKAVQDHIRSIVT